MAEAPRTNDTIIVDDLLKTIEEVNADYLELKDSEEYRVGVRVLDFRQKLREGRFLELVRKMTRLKLMVASDKGAEARRAARPSQDSPALANKELVGNERICVYTCVTGGYDSIQKPAYKPGACEFVAFSDAAITCPGWTVKDLTQMPEAATSANPNRYCKMHPAEVAPGFDYALYIDGNVRVLSDIRPLLGLGWLYTRTQSGIACTTRLRYA